jgi:hypothetical protein
MFLTKKGCPKFFTILVFLSIFIGTFSGLAFSALTYGVTIANNGQIAQGINVASGSSADIQAAVDLLKTVGGNVIIPEGIFSWSASDSVTIPGGVNLFGASPAGCEGHEANWATNLASTIIHKNASIVRGGLITLDGSNGKSSRVSGIQFEANPINGGSDSDNNYGLGISISGMVNYRVDHCTFKNFIQIAVYIGSTSTITSRGVLDHNVVDNPYKLSGGPYYWGYGFYVANDYYQIGDWNTNVANFAGKYDGMPAKTTLMFVEDNHFSRCRHSTDGISGGWGVIRFNLIDNSIPQYGDIDSHGSAAWVSARGFEAYNNTINEKPSDDSNYGNGDIAIRLRDGSGFVFNNTFAESPGNVNGAYLMYLDDDSSYYGTYLITKVNQTYIWSNNYSECGFINNRGGYIQNVNYFLRAPTLALDGFTYIPFTYPHPLAK